MDNTGTVTSTNAGSDESEASTCVGGVDLRIVKVADAEQVRVELANAGIRAAVRAGSVRLSTHVYNTPEEINRAVSALARSVPQIVGR